MSIADVVANRDIRGISTFQDDSGIRYLALWVLDSSGGVAENRLLAYRQIGDGYEAIFSLDAQSTEDALWEKLETFPSARSPGIALYSLAGDYFYGSVIVVGVVDGRMKVVYSGNTSEFIDLNGDGVAEIVESVWPNGDGYPTNAKVYIWSGGAYKHILTARWPDRLGRATLNAVNKSCTVSKGRVPLQ
ncbi:MAG: hypothetical protein IT175_04820 [Acidobacteria bacterium]|nr:hypothetical protein [Acidobacteriota bacterium]